MMANGYNDQNSFLILNAIAINNNIHTYTHSMNPDVLHVFFFMILLACLNCTRRDVSTVLKYRLLLV